MYMYDLRVCGMDLSLFFDVIKSIESSSDGFNLFLCFNIKRLPEKSQSTLFLAHLLFNRVTRAAKVTSSASS